MTDSNQTQLKGQTHEVLNQARYLEPYNMYLTDIPLNEGLERAHGTSYSDHLTQYGETAGGVMMEWGFKANEFKPVFYPHDRYGHRIDFVEYHPYYHCLMSTSIENGIVNIPWKDQTQGRHAARLALGYMHQQAESGSGCPLTMTFACIPTIQKQPNIAESWIPKILSSSYDGRNVPYFEKEGLTIGMAMTEKQGGSDVRANKTIATPVQGQGPGELYEITGHKWFCSAPMCDGFLILAQAPKGLSCFLLPRFKPDGTMNHMHVQRLKNKLGNLSNASSEVEYFSALAWMIGEEGRGVANILEMVALTRYDCMIGSSALMRQALSQALNHTSQREAFGNTLILQPLMQNVLADLSLESEASLLFSLRLAQALENQDHAHEKNIIRLMTAIGKYWICKRAPQFVNEASECLGGAGYVEESNLPRLYREAPVNSIWEGSGNIQCLDVLRALNKDPIVMQSYFEDIEPYIGHDESLKKYFNQLYHNAKKDLENQTLARSIIEKMALVYEGALFYKAGLDELGKTFCEQRLENRGLQYGTLPKNAPLENIIKRNFPGGNPF